MAYDTTVEYIEEVVGDLWRLSEHPEQQMG